MKYFRFSRPIARHLYNRGCKVVLVPCKVNLNSPWIIPYIISNELNIYKVNQFDRLARDYRIDICCYVELGYYPHFYVSEEEIERTSSSEYLDKAREVIESATW